MLEVGGRVGGQVAEVAAEPLEAALHRVDVGVGEAGQQQPAVDVHDPGARDGDVGADRGDPAVLDQDLPDPAAVAEPVEDGGVAEDGGAHRAILHPAARRAARPIRSCTMSTIPGTTDERGLARLAQRSAAWTEKWFPDAYVFALAGVVLVSVAAMVNGSSPVHVAETFGGGFWDLATFTLQMAMVVLTGYVVATSPRSPG